MLNEFKSQAGISLTELMVAIGIIGSIASVAVAKMDDVLPAARDAQRKANLHEVRNAIYMYSLDRGSFPLTASRKATSDGWSELENALMKEPGIPYLSEMPVDPLNQDIYRFKYYSDGRIFEIEYETEDPSDASPRKIAGY